jgi:DNA-binding NarL/FixJ family response regulator
MSKQKDDRKNKGNKNGRPFAINEEMEKEISQLLSDGMSQAKVAQAMGINEKTIIEHRGGFRSFRSELKKLKGKRINSLTRA